MGDDARSCYEALETLDATSEMDTMGNLIKLVQKRPNYVQNKWRSHSHKLRKEAR